MIRKNALSIVMCLFIMTLTFLLLLILMNVSSLALRF